jgi:hypothetical protein
LKSENGGESIITITTASRENCGGNCGENCGRNCGENIEEL